MLEIIFVTQQGYSATLELSGDSSLEIEAVSPSFDTNLSEGSFSLPISVPWTAANRKNLGAPEMLESILLSGEVYWPCELRRDGVVEMYGAKLTLLSVEGDLDYVQGTYNMAVTGPESLFGSLVKGVKLADLNLGGVINYTTPSRYFAEAVMTGQYPDVRSRLAFAPVLNTEYFDSGRSDYDDEELEKNTINQVFLSPLTGTWHFGCGQTADETQLATPGDPGYTNYRTVPFFSFLYILRKIFEDFKYNVSGDVLLDARLQNVYIDNRFSLEAYQAANADLNRRIYPRNHMPDVAVVDFLTAFSQIFNFKIDWLANGYVSITFNKTPDKAAGVDMTKYVDSTYKAELTDETKDGVKINYKFPSDDGAVADRIKDVDPEQVRGYFNSLADANAFTFSPALADGDLILVWDENYYYQYSGEYGHFIYYGEAYDPIIIGNGTTEINPEAAPLLKAVGTDDSGNNYHLNMVESRGIGSYVNNHHVRVTTPCPLRFFFIDMKPVGTYTNPMPVSYNSYSSLSLTMKGDNGIYATYLRSWYALLCKTRLVTANIYLPLNYTVSELFRKAIRINNHFFMLKKIRYTIGNTEPAEAELIKI